MAIGYDTNSYLADLFSDSTKKYWTLSPVSSNNGNDAFVCRNSIIWWSNGKLVFNYSEPPKDNYEVLPTITLKPDVGFTTTGEGEPGTSTNPYIIQ